MPASPLTRTVDAAPARAAASARVERLQLLGAADEDRTRDAADHVSIIAAGGRACAHARSITRS